MAAAIVVVATAVAVVRPARTQQVSASWNQQVVPAAFVDADPNGADLMAVTVEPARCPSQPTTRPVYTAQPVAT